MASLYTLGYKLTFNNTKCVVTITPGNSKSLWQAVKLAKNFGITHIPDLMTLGGVEISGQDISHGFANFFDKKVNDIVISTKVNNNVYNGAQKIQAQSDMFMTREKIKEYYFYYFFFHIHLSSLGFLKVFFLGFKKD